MISNKISARIQNVKESVVIHRAPSLQLGQES